MLAYKESEDQFGPANIVFICDSLAKLNWLIIILAQRIK